MVRRENKLNCTGTFLFCRRVSLSRPAGGLRFDQFDLIGIRREQLLTELLQPAVRVLITGPGVTNASPEHGDLLAELTEIALHPAPTPTASLSAVFELHASQTQYYRRTVR